MLTVRAGEELRDVTALKQYLALQNLTTRFRIAFMIFALIWLAVKELKLNYHTVYTYVLNSVVSRLW